MNHVSFLIASQYCAVNAHKGLMKCTNSKHFPHQSSCNLILHIHSFLSNIFFKIMMPSLIKEKITSILKTGFFYLLLSIATYVWDNCLLKKLSWKCPDIQEAPGHCPDCSCAAASSATALVLTFSTYCQRVLTTSCHDYEVNTHFVLW